MFVTSSSSRTIAASGSGGSAPLRRLPDLRDAQLLVGVNREIARQFLTGELTVELMPQGTLAERLRTGGMGIPAFYTPAGVGTQVSDGGIPWRYNPDGTVHTASPTKETREFRGRRFVLEDVITTDFSLAHAKRGDRYGNLVFNKAVRSFNPLCAMAVVSPRLSS